MEEKIRLAVFGQKRLSREGGIEIVVKELCTRMAQKGCDVTCYNRAGHHVSGAEYDKTIEYDGIGFCIEEDGGFVGMYELVVNDKVQRENINSIKCLDEWLIQIRAFVCCSIWKKQSCSHRSHRNMRTRLLAK